MTAPGFVETEDMNQGSLFFSRDGTGNEIESGSEEAVIRVLEPRLRAFSVITLRVPASYSASLMIRRELHLLYNAGFRDASQCEKVQRRHQLKNRPRENGQTETDHSNSQTIATYQNNLPSYASLSLFVIYLFIYYQLTTPLFVGRH